MRHITRVLVMTVVAWAGVLILAAEVVTDFLQLGFRAQILLAGATILAAALVFVLTDYLKMQWAKVLKAYDEEDRQRAPRGNQE